VAKEVFLVTVAVELATVADGALPAGLLVHLGRVGHALLLPEEQGIGETSGLGLTLLRLRIHGVSVLIADLEHPPFVLMAPPPVPPRPYTPLPIVQVLRTDHPCEVLGNLNRVGVVVDAGDVHAVCVFLQLLLALHVLLLHVVVTHLAHRLHHQALERRKSLCHRQYRVIPIVRLLQRQL